MDLNMMLLVIPDLVVYIHILYFSAERLKMPRMLSHASERSLLS